MNTFIFIGKKYDYFRHPYNNTEQNERIIEVPIVWSIVKKYKGKRILEVGNVLSHYFNVNYDIVDKYEKAKNVKNIDINDFKTNVKYDLIVSISTLEHISKNKRDIIDTFNHLKSMLKIGGKLVVTVPIGYNKAVDLTLKEGEFVSVDIFYMKRLDSNNNWAQVNYDEIKNLKYGKPFRCGNGVAIITFEKIIEEILKNET